MLCNQILATQGVVCLSHCHPQLPFPPQAHHLSTQDISSQPLQASAEQHPCFSSCKQPSIKYMLDQYFKDTATSINAVVASSWENQGELDQCGCCDGKFFGWLCGGWFPSLCGAVVYFFSCLFLQLPYPLSDWGHHLLPMVFLSKTLVTDSVTLAFNNNNGLFCLQAILR